MKINLFVKLVATYIAVIFTAMSVAGGLQYFLLRDYLLDNKTFYRVEQIYTIAALLGIGMSVVLGLVLSRYITKPLREASRVAHRIAEGNFDDRVKVNSPDELGQLGSAINYMTDRLAEYENMRRDFVANVSHELRSPITSIRGFIDALAEGRDKDQEEREKYLDILQKETYRLSKLVNDLLEISKFDAQGIQLSMEPFPVFSIINRAASSLKPQLERKGLFIDYKASEDVMCYGDEDRIEQVVHNLLENAVRYSPAGATIGIAATRWDNEILVQVTDKGPGIAKEEIPRIWERFYRVDKDRSRSKGGTGLGLAIVQEIIRKHGGRVMVKSEPGQGAVFGFTLPVAEE